MRDYTNIDRYITELQGDVYGQPTSDGHLEAIKDVMLKWVFTKADVKTILDVGCGQGESIEFGQQYGKYVEGVTLPPDYDVIQQKKPSIAPFVHNADMHFMPFPDKSFDAVFIRHALEHSYMPLILLKDLYRISKKYVFVVVPSHAVGVVGDNHYSILTSPMWERLFELAGFVMTDKVEKAEPVIELRFQLEKREFHGQEAKN